MTYEQHTNRDRVLRLAAVMAVTGMARSTVYKRIQEGTFPAPFRLGKNSRSVGWSELAVNEWIEEQKGAA